MSTLGATKLVALRPQQLICVVIAQAQIDVHQTSGVRLKVTSKFQVSVR